MTVSIIGNNAASYAQSAITARNEAMTLSTQRITSGIRVISAGDDAAALAVGTSLKIENSALSTAVLNATSGTSMLQIVDGALGQISDILIRMKTLAAQASSGHLDDASRLLANGEFSTLMQEVERLANGTIFNSIPLLIGSKDYVTTSASNMSADGISGIRFDQNVMTGDAAFRYSYDAATEVVSMERLDDDGSVADAQSIDLTGLLDAAAGTGQNLSGGKMLEVGFSGLGVMLTLGSGFDRGQALAADVTPLGGTAMTMATPTLAVPTADVSLDTVAGLVAVATATPAAYDTTTGQLTLTLDSDGTNVTLGAIPGVSYKVNGTATASGAASGALDATANTIEVYVDLPGGGTQLVGTLTTGAVATTVAGSDTMKLGVGAGVLVVKDSGNVAPRYLTYKVGMGVVAGQDTIAVEVPAMTLIALGLEDAVSHSVADITSEANADDAIDKLNAALQVLNEGRATVGAQQVRMEAVITNLGVVTENNEAARSALMDVDVAKEISDLTTDQVMMQASIAMLGRANQLPGILLELLKNS